MNEKSPHSVFFIERCLGKHPILEILRAKGVTVEVHDDHFPQNAKDQDWIPQIGEWGWIILTKEERIAKNIIQRQAVARAGIRMFIITSKKLTGKETAIGYGKALQAMLKFIEKHPKPFIAKVYKNGSVFEWKEAQDLLDEIN